MYTTDQVISQLDISSKTFSRWLKELNLPSSTRQWTQEQFDFFQALKDRLNSTPRVSLKQAIAELTGEESEQEPEDRQELGLQQQIGQHYADAALALAPTMVKVFATLLDGAVADGLSKHYQNAPKGSTLLEKAFKRNSKQLNERDILALLPGTVNTDEILDAEFVDGNA